MCGEVLEARKDQREFKRKDMNVNFVQLFFFFYLYA